MDLDKLNSATKYPSILTYHEMGDRGRLRDTVQVPFPAGDPVYLTEKLDGTNARILMLPDGPRRYIIGSREEFLTAQGDLIFGKEYGIVKALEPIAERLSAQHGYIAVHFFEVFGAGLPAAKQYTAGQTIAVRLFDVALIPLDALDKPIEKIAAWRDHGGQPFMRLDQLEHVVEGFQESGIPINQVPSQGAVTSLPTALDATYEWLKAFERSQCDLGGGQGRAEGVVARTLDRKTIAKIRFEDYERTLGVKRTK